MYRHVFIHNRVSQSENVLEVSIVVLLQEYLCPSLPIQLKTLYELALQLFSSSYLSPLSHFLHVLPKLCGSHQE